MIPVLRDPIRGVGRFVGRPRLELMEAPEGRTRALYLGGLEYVTHDGSSIVPRIGLIYDGASIPDPLWVHLGPPLCWTNVFGLVHDDMYRFGDVVDRNGNRRAITRNEADRYAWDMALTGGHSPATAVAIYEGLVLGGAHAWKTNEARRRECGSDVARLLAWC
jgi:hypothetical protein